MTRFLQYAVFVAGLAVVGWVGAGYIGSNPLALAVTAIIGASYLMGRWNFIASSRPPPH